MPMTCNDSRSLSLTGTNVGSDISQRYVSIQVPGTQECGRPTKPAAY